MRELNRDIRESLRCIRESDTLTPGGKRGMAPSSMDSNERAAGGFVNHGFTLTPPVMSAAGKGPARVDFDVSIEESARAGPLSGEWVERSHPPTGVR